ncbi:MAG: GyrI-like domain-containing protein [candidate division KSB1 bacterium]|nr:GyrI-like domain-containing protein [candidate division KSB1 bacterium]MDZ7412153.1 GyrI-like domain-containing protein [candidate division KSB1 bacterium]
MGKIDLKKDLKHLYSPSAIEVSVLEVPPMNFLMVNGTGDPNTSQEYQQAMEALFSLSYALKFRVKKSTGADYAVMPLEGLWWTDDPSQFSMSNRTIWKWTAMIMQPEYVAAEMVAEALDEVRKKKGSPALEGVRFETYHEGLSAQIMHIGPYAAEEPTIARLHSFIRKSCYELSGKHHEIYLNDPRRTAPEKLKTVLRQPIRR